MQRKTLNIYFDRNENQFKLRFIEMQVIEEPPRVCNHEIFSLLSSVEETFALALSNALDRFNHRFVSKNNLEQSQLFQRFCPSYDRQIITDPDNPACRYTFHNIEWLLFDTTNLPGYQSSVGDESDLMMQLGAFDDAITSFVDNARRDGYEVSIQYSDQSPDLDDKFELAHDACTDAPATMPTVALSRRIISWMASQCRRDSSHEQSFLYNNLLPLLQSEDNSLKKIVHDAIYIKQPTKPSPQQFCLFAHEIKAGGGQPQNDVTAEKKLKR